MDLVSIVPKEWMSSIKNVACDPGSLVLLPKKDKSEILSRARGTIEGKLKIGHEHSPELEKAENAGFLQLWMKWNIPRHAMPGHGLPQIGSEKSDMRNSMTSLWPKAVNNGGVISKSFICDGGNIDFTPDHLIIIRLFSGSPTYLLGLNLNARVEIYVLPYTQTNLGVLKLLMSKNCMDQRIWKTANEEVSVSDIYAKVGEAVAKRAADESIVPQKWLSTIVDTLKGTATLRGEKEVKTFEGRVFGEDGFMRESSLLLRTDPAVPIAIKDKDRLRFACLGVRACFKKDGDAAVQEYMDSLLMEVMQTGWLPR
jgi:hypothetical protein